MARDSIALEKLSRPRRFSMMQSLRAFCAKQSYGVRGDCFVAKNAPRNDSPFGCGWKPRYVRFAIICLVVLTAAYLRFANLAINPGWYTDEGTLILIGQQIQHGRWQYLGIENSVLIVGRPPLFVGFLGLIFKIFGSGILQLRFVSAFLGVMTTGSSHSSASVP